MAKRGPKPSVAAPDRMVSHNITIPARVKAALAALPDDARAAAQAAARRALVRSVERGW